MSQVAVNPAETLNDAGGNPSRVPFAITDRVFIPRQRYFDKEFFELEKDKLWAHTWQMACRLEEIPDVGDYVEYWVADYSVLVVRTSPSEIKAYQNACRHRATQLAVGCGRFRGGQIVCPFHGWRWNLDGTAARPLYGEEGFDPRCMDSDDLRLIECQVGTWANCVFINMDRGARPLLEALDPIPRLLDPLNVGQMYVSWWKAVRLKANWKMAMEAFMEGWHTMQTHPQLTMGAGADFHPDFLAHQSHPNGHAHLQFREETEGAPDLGLSAQAEAERAIEFLRVAHEGLNSMALSKDLHVVEGMRTLQCEPGTFSQKMVEQLHAWNTGAGIPFPALEPETLARWGGGFFIFPNFFILPLYGNALLYRSRPDDPQDPEHCYYELWSVTLYPTGHEPGKPTFGGVHAKDDDTAWPRVPMQDFSNIERQQRGIHTPGFTQMRLSHRWEDAIANMHTHIDSYLAR
jgi:phenylpropionate dioxygenase-like ring-hydroxylating dioxygenase large terminal subunit